MAHTDPSVVGRAGMITRLEACGGVKISAHNQLHQIRADGVQAQPRCVTCAHVYG